MEQSNRLSGSCHPRKCGESGWQRMPGSGQAEHNGLLLQDDYPRSLDPRTRVRTPDALPWLSRCDLSLGNQSGNAESPCESSADATGSQTKTPAGVRLVECQFNPLKSRAFPVQGRKRFGVRSRSLRAFGRISRSSPINIAQQTGRRFDRRRLDLDGLTGGPEMARANLAGESGARVRICNQAKSGRFALA